MSDEPVYQLTLTQRTMILLTVVLSTTIYAGSVLISRFGAVRTLRGARREDARAPAGEPAENGHGDRREDCADG